LGIGVVKKNNDYMINSNGTNGWCFMVHLNFITQRQTDKQVAQQKVLQIIIQKNGRMGMLLKQ
jgi:hypothetical protein